jgi:hypothetical protein
MAMEEEIPKPLDHFSKYEFPPHIFILSHPGPAIIIFIFNNRVDEDGNNVLEC